MMGGGHGNEERKRGHILQVASVEIGGDESDKSSMPESLTIKIVSILRAAIVPTLKYM